VIGYPDIGQTVLDGGSRDHGIMAGRFQTAVRYSQCRASSGAPLRSS